MKLTAGDIFKAVPVLTAIINERRPMPQAGKFRLARMHAKLMDEFLVIHRQREDMIKAYDTHVKVPDPKYVAPEGDQAVVTEPPMIDGPEYTVPADKLEEYAAAEKALFAETVEVQILPIPIGMLSPANSQNGSVEADELVLLGDLIADLTEVAA